MEHILISAKPRFLAYFGCVDCSLVSMSCHIPGDGVNNNKDGISYVYCCVKISCGFQKTRSIRSVSGS
jgi:hypothetical protein